MIICNVKGLDVEPNTDILSVTIRQKTKIYRVDIDPHCAFI